MGQVVTSDLVKSVSRGLKTLFMTTVNEGYQPMWDQIATRVESDGPNETYAWLGESPGMREWKDERQAVGLTEYSYTISNKKFESTLGVDRTALEDEQYGQIRLRVQELAGKARIHYDKIVADALETNGVASDGQNLIDTDHSTGASGTQSNKGTTALSATSFNAGRVALAGLKDDQGEKIGARATILMVPPDLEGTARSLLNAEMVSDGSGAGITNVWRGAATLLVNPWLTDANNWYLIDGTQTIKPLLLQIRTPIEFSSLTNDSEPGFMRDVFYYGTRARHNVGYGRWQSIYGAIVA